MGKAIKILKIQLTILEQGNLILALNLINVMVRKLNHLRWVRLA